MITAKGPVITIDLNGRQTAVIKDAKFLSGPFALQGGSHGKEAGGAIKWRKVNAQETEIARARAGIARSWGVDAVSIGVQATRVIQ